MFGPMRRIRRVLVGALVLLLVYGITGLVVRAPDAGVAPGHDSRVFTAEGVLVLLAVTFAAVVGLIALVAWARGQEFARPPRRRWYDVVAGIMLFLACLFVAQAIGEHQGATEIKTGTSARQQPQQPSPQLPQHGVTAHLDLVALMLFVALGALLVLAAVRSRRRALQIAEAMTNERSGAATADAIDVILLDLRSEPDARRAIIAAYARMERLMQDAGHPRAPYETPMEYLARVLLEVGARAGSVDRLTTLYERAQYSSHEVGPAMKAAALEALETLRAELRGDTPSELVPW